MWTLSWGEGDPGEAMRCMWKAAAEGDRAGGEGRGLAALGLLQSLTPFCGREVTSLSRRRAGALRADTGQRPAQSQRLSCTGQGPGPGDSQSREAPRTPLVLSRNPKGLQQPLPGAHACGRQLLSPEPLRQG